MIIGIGAGRLCEYIHQVDAFYMVCRCSCFSVSGLVFCLLAFSFYFYNYLRSIGFPSHLLPVILDAQRLLVTSLCSQFLLTLFFTCNKVLSLSRFKAFCGMCIIFLLSICALVFHYVVALPVLQWFFHPETLLVFTYSFIQESFSALWMDFLCAFVVGEFFCVFLKSLIVIMLLCS